MPIIGRPEQQPNDVADYDVDFSEFFPWDDVIVSSTVSSDIDGPGVTCASMAGNVVKVWFKDGAAGVDYKLTLRAVTAGGRRKEVELVIRVRED